MHMNQITISEPQFFTVMADDGNSYFAPVLELDYDEPNAVVEEMDVEFVRAEQFVQTVFLPVSPVLVAEEPVLEHASFEIGQRSAA